MKANLLPEEGRRVLGGMSRQTGMLVSVGLLAGSAVLIAVDRRGLIDGLAKEIAGLAGLILGLSGGLLLIQIWWAGRFRVSIMRLMVIVALMAVLFQGVLIYRDWVQKSLPPRRSFSTSPSP